MRVEESDTIPRPIEAHFERLGWRSKADRKWLWLAMKEWVLKRGHAYRKYLVAENVKEHFAAFFTTVYAIRFLTEMRSKRNPQVNMAKPFGKEMTEE